MIRFDNGPPDGDYVRYIDALMKERAASLVAATMTSDTDSVDRIRAAGGRKRPMSAAPISSSSTSPAFKAPHERSRDAKSPANPDVKPRASVMSSPSNSPPALSPAAATAIASAMMRRDAELGTVPAVGTIVSATGIAVGVILILIGILGRTSNVLFIVAGIALVSWAIKRLGGSAATAGPSTSTDAFTGMLEQRTSAHTETRESK